MTTVQSRSTCFDDGSVDALEAEAAVDLLVGSRNHSANVAKLAPIKSENELESNFSLTVSAGLPHFPIDFRLFPALADDSFWAWAAELV